MVPVTKGFNSKTEVRHREYDYYLPTFLLSEHTNMPYSIIYNATLMNNTKAFKRIPRENLVLKKEDINNLYPYRMPDDRKE